MTARKRKPARKGKAKATPRRIDRPLMDELIRDLSGRLAGLEAEADAFALVVAPEGGKTPVDSGIQLAYGVMLRSLQVRIRDARLFSEIIAGRDG